MSDELLTKLMEQYGDQSIPFGEEDVKGGSEFITKDGKYAGFITECESLQVTRQNATKTKPAGSVYYWLKPVIKVDHEVATNEKFAGNIKPSIRYEPGHMLEFEKFCIATKCKAFNVDGKRIYFPQAENEKGGSVGMPVIFDIKMKKDVKKRKNQETGEWETVISEVTGEPEDVFFPEVIAWYQWETTERYVSEEAKAPEANIIEDDDLPF